eukprot:2087800-Rhodomonas_salina.1
MSGTDIDRAATHAYAVGFLVLMSMLLQRRVLGTLGRFCTGPTRSEVVPAPYRPKKSLRDVQYEDEYYNLSAPLPSYECTMRYPAQY